MKNIRLYIMLVLCIFILNGCTKPVENNIDMLSGEIKSIEDNSIEIETLDENKSRFLVYTKDANIKDGIKQGDIIEISYKGGVMESDPMQINATEINLISQLPIKKEIMRNAIMIKGELYYNTGEEITLARCGVMDGKIESTVDEYQLPTKDNQSNFGKGYEYQYVGNKSIDVVIDNKWIRFAKDIDLVDGLSMDIIEHSNEHIKINIVNNTKYDFNYGEAYTIEKLNEGNWERIKSSEDVAFIEIAYALDKGRTNLWETNIKFIYGELESGKYRIIKDFFNSEQNYQIATEFEIE